MVAARDSCLDSGFLEAREDLLHEPAQALERDHSLEVADEEHRRRGECDRRVSLLAPVRTCDVWYRRVEVTAVVGAVRTQPRRVVSCERAARLARVQEPDE